MADQSEYQRPKQPGVILPDVGAESDGEVTQSGCSFSHSCQLTGDALFVHVFSARSVTPFPRTMKPPESPKNPGSLRQPFKYRGRRERTLPCEAIDSSLRWNLGSSA